VQLLTDKPKTLSLLTLLLVATLLVACSAGSSSDSLGGGYVQGSGAAVALTPRAGVPNLVAPRVDALAPAMQLTTFDGKQVSLGELLKQHKVVLVNFWATWCPPCRAEMPDIEAVYERFGPQGLTVAAVNMQESDHQVAGYAQEGGYTFPLLLDPTVVVANAYRVMSLPTSYFVGQDGRVLAVNMGAMTQASLEDKLQQFGFSK